mmetsp:Transcript_4443/g.12444  ORF Transcript_4443/g.12444 Transcript_4443/m.12444 type:complete len:238 (-) Transcript_4443:211-924(-)
MLCLPGPPEATDLSLQLLGHSEQPIQCFQLPGRAQLRIAGPLEALQLLPQGFATVRECVLRRPYLRGVPGHFAPLTKNLRPHRHRFLSQLLNHFLRQVPTVPLHIAQRRVHQTFQKGSPVLHSRRRDGPQVLIGRSLRNQVHLLCRFGFPERPNHGHQLCCLVELRVHLGQRKLRLHPSLGKRQVGEKVRVALVHARHQLLVDIHIVHAHSLTTPSLSLSRTRLDTLLSPTNRQRSS